MMLEFAGDPACDTLDRQYMLGESLLVAPVFTAEGAVQYYLPPGRWTNLITGDAVNGPGWQTEQHSYLSLPLMVRPNTLLALGARDDAPDYNYAERVILRLFQLEDGREAKAAVPDLTGATVLSASVSRTGSTYDVAVAGSGSWRLELNGVRSVASVEGGSAAASDVGVRITPNSGVTHLTISVTSGLS
jgi:alpha-D-xyloside xylohydrolase